MSGFPLANRTGSGSCMKFTFMSVVLLWTLVARPSQFDDESLILVFLQEQVVYLRDPVRQKKQGSLQQPAPSAFILLYLVLKQVNGCWGCVEITYLRSFLVPCPFLICMHHICLNGLSAGKVQLFGTKFLMINTMAPVSVIVNFHRAGKMTGSHQN